MSIPGRTRKGGERMSNYLAIATATATLRTLLQNAVTPNVPGVSVNTTRPHAEGNDNPPTDITIYPSLMTPSNTFSTHQRSARDPAHFIAHPTTPAICFSTPYKTVH